MEAEQAKKLVLMLVAYYETWKPTPETLTVYENLLLAFDAPLAEAAITKIMQTSESAFVPKVGTIARMIAEASLEARNQKTPSPEEAWGTVYGQIQSRGYYQGPAISSPAIMRGVKAIGWQALCTSENIAADRAHFMRVYSAFRERAIEGEIIAICGSRDLAQLARQTLEIEHDDE